MQISLQTPQAKYAYRLLEFSHMSPQSVTCQIHSYGSDQFLAATLLLLQVAPTMREVSFKGFESATNIFACGT